MHQERKREKNIVKRFCRSRSEKGKKKTRVLLLVDSKIRSVTGRADGKRNEPSSKTTPRHASEAGLIR